MKRLIPLLALFTACATKEPKVEVQALTSKQQIIVTAVKKNLRPTDYFEIKTWHPSKVSTDWPDKSIPNPTWYGFDFDYKNEYGVVLKQTGVAILDNKDSVLTAGHHDRK